MSKSKLPKDWDEPRVKRVAEHYETQSDEEATAEDELREQRDNSHVLGWACRTGFQDRELIAKRRAS